MPNTTDTASQLAAQLGADASAARSHVLTVDNTVRRVTLSTGGWRLYGASTQVYYATRAASAAGVIDASLAAPATTDLRASVAGTPTTGNAWDVGVAGVQDTASNGCLMGGAPLPTDTTQWVNLGVGAGAYLNLYVRVASGSAAPVLVGPFPRPT